MAKEINKPQKEKTTQEDPNAEQEPILTNREKWNKAMTDRIPNYNPEDEEGSYGMMLDQLAKNDEEKKKLSDAITSDPRIAQLLSDIVSGKRNAPGALVRYFGKDYLSAEEGTPEYDEIMAAEEERKADADKAAASQKEYNDNLQASIPVIDNFCKDKGEDPDKFMQDVWDKIVSPIMQGTYTPMLCEMLYKAFNYDKDISDAMEAGEVKGRNTNIQKLRNQPTDGMPSGLTTAPQKAPQKRGHNILDLAREA